MNWDQYDVLRGTLPEAVKVHIIDQHDMPTNWNNDLFGPWFARRIMFVGIPSMHSPSKIHKVVVSFLPSSWPFPQNFTNRLGFVQEGLDRIIEFGCVGPHCRIGYRLNSCCAHVMTAILLVAIYGKGDDSFVSTSKPYHLLDVANPPGLNEQVLAPRAETDSDSDSDSSSNSGSSSN